MTYSSQWGRLVIVVDEAGKDRIYDIQQREVTFGRSAMVPTFACPAVVLDSWSELECSASEGAGRSNCSRNWHTCFLLLDLG